MLNDSEEAFLRDYNIHDFDVPLTTVDMSIFSLREESLQVLLVKRGQHPQKGRWALPGGFIDLSKDSDLDATAYRKLHEKTAVNAPYLEQLGTFGSNNRDPRGWSVTVAYLALIKSDDVQLESRDHSSESVEWRPIDEALNCELAFDHQSILRTALQRLKSKVQYTSLPTHLLPNEFTLTELQRTFELIMNHKVEKKSFRRRILDAGILEDTGKLRTGSNRPAALFKVKAGQSSSTHFFSRNLEGSRS